MDIDYIIMAKRSLNGFKLPFKNKSLFIWPGQNFVYIFNI